MYHLVLLHRLQSRQSEENRGREDGIQEKIRADRRKGVGSRQADKMSKRYGAEIQAWIICNPGGLTKVHQTILTAFVFICSKVHLLSLANYNHNSLVGCSSGIH